MQGQIKQKLSENGQKMLYCLAQKQSEKGFQWNDRILILVDQKYLGYIKIPNKKNYESHVEIKNIKLSYLIKNIRSIFAKEDNVLQILINDYSEGKQSKPKSVKWIFKVSSKQITNQWIDLVLKQMSPYTTRKNTVDNDHGDKNYDPALNNPTIKQLSEELKKQGYTQTVSDQKVQKKQLPKAVNTEKRESQISFQEKDEGFKKFIKEEPKQPVSPTKAQNNQQQQYNLSKMLEKQVDLKKVEEEYQSYKNSTLKKNNKQMRGMGLNNHITTTIEAFTNYFRPLTPKIKDLQIQPTVNDQQYEAFIQYCQGEAQKMIHSKIQLVDTEQYSIKDNVVVMKGIIFEFIFSEIKQIPGNNSVCDQGRIKACLNKQKNMNYIWKIIAHDKELSQVFSMPMNCIVEYLGYIVCCTCQFEDKKGQNKSIQNDYSYFFEKLSSLTKIHRNVLQSQELVKFMRVNNKFVIYQVSQYLPRFINNATMIRPELFQKTFKQSAYQTKKGKRQQQQQNRLFNIPVKENIEIVSTGFDRLDEYIFHPRQLSKIMHQYGLNMNMVGKLLSNISNIFMQSIIKTEIVVRAFKMLFRKKLQETYNENPEVAAKKMLNILLSKNNQSETMWKIVCLHASNYFGVTPAKQDINKGYLFLGLEYHLGIVIKTQHQSCESIFEVNYFVNGIRPFSKVKNCHIFWMEDSEDIANEDLAAILVDKLYLQTKSIPYYIRTDYNTFQKIIDVLSLYYRPGSFSNLNIYKKAEKNNEISLAYLRRQITQIKWMIKTNEINQSKVAKKLQEIKEQIHFYYGTIHPLFAQLSDLLTLYFLSNQKYQLAMKEIKNSLATIIQLCGGKTMHIKLASNYYQMGDCYFQWKKYDDAIAHYKKAKNILQFNNCNSEKDYAIVLYKMGLLYLSKKKDQEALKLLETAQTILNADTAQNLSEIIQILQLLSRCASNDPQRKRQILQKSLLVVKIGNDSDIGTDEQMIKLIKIIVSLYFFEQSELISVDFIMFIEDESDILRKTVMDSEKALQIVKQFIINDKMIETLKQFPQKSEYLSNIRGKFVQNKGSKEIQLFQQLIHSLILVTSEGFVLGVLNQYHSY